MMTRPVGAFVVWFMTSRQVWSDEEVAESRRSNIEHETGFPRRSFGRNPWTIDSSFFQCDKSAMLQRGTIFFGAHPPSTRESNDEEYRETMA